MTIPALRSTIAGEATDELVVKRSRFLCRIVHVTDVAGADAVVAATRKEHWDARHHCVALVIGAQGDIQRSTDDGEPSGTAGVPMLEVLHHRGLTDVVAVVTRYFGGVLLGAGGLMRAYTAAVAQAIDQAHIVRRELRDVVDIAAALTDVGRVENHLRTWSAAHDGVLESVDYTASGAVMRLLVRPGDRDALASELAATTSGTVHPEFISQRIVNL